MGLSKNEENMLKFLFENRDKYMNFHEICEQMIATKDLNLSVLQTLLARTLVKWGKVKGYRITTKGCKYITYKELALVI